MASSIKTNRKISTESATPDTISLDKQPIPTNPGNITATTVAANLILPIITKVATNAKTEIIPMSISATNLPVAINFGATLQNDDINPHSNLATMTENKASCSQVTTSTETLNRPGTRATEQTENGAGKQVRFTDSTVSTNPNAKYFR